MLYREIKPQTVLIVDDEPANISLLNEVLKTDYRIMVAKDGKRALLVAQSNPPPDLILLDIVMPGMTGRQLADIAVKAPGDSTKVVQEAHLVLYHTFCAMIEAHYFPDPR